MDLKDSDLLCDLCNISLPNQQSKLSHVLGRKHQLALHRDHMSELKERCGIFVSGFPNLLQHDEILSCFSAYGKITDHFFGDGNRFAILQFDSPEPVEVLLKATIMLRGRTLQVKRRFLRDRGQPNFTPPNENYEEINENLKEFPDFQTQLVMLVRRVQPNWLEMVKKYEALCIDLQNILQETFPECVVHPFGSTVTGLGFTTSDVDIYVEVFKVSGTDNASTSQLSHATICVNKSKKLLHKHGRIFSQVFAIPKAKTPIVKCVHKPTQISCDFNFKNMLGVCNSSLTRYYLSLDNKLKSVMIILKYWAKVHELSGSSGKFSNYSLIMMFIFYLQQEPYLLPPVITLQDEQKCNKPQDGWNGEFEQLRNFVSEPLSNQSIPEILHGFFDYYGNFDYALNAVCPYLGRTVLKTDFLKPELLPDAFNRYKINIAGKQPLRVETSVCVQDPFEHNHNVSSSVPAKLLEEFVGLCKLGAEIFQNQPVGNLALYRLFTDEVESIDFKKYLGSDTECKFKIPMGNHLLYLNNEITSREDAPVDAEEKIIQMRMAWYNIVNKFIVTVLTNVMKFTVSVEKDSPEIKSQRLNGQSDVHDDPNKIDSVAFHCSGIYNLWEARKAIAKDITLDEKLMFLDKQMNLTSYICDVLYKGINLKEVILELTIDMQANINPTEMVFHITKISCRKGCFKSFAAYFAKNIPAWFERHITELDKSLEPATEEGTSDKPENLQADIN